MTITAGISERCVQQILELVSDSALFGPKKSYDVYDPSIFLDIVKPVNYPVCGVTYGGIYSENQGYDQGNSSSIVITLIILGESKIRDAKRQADRGAITALLDKTRFAILNDGGTARKSPTGKDWQFVTEQAAELKDNKTKADRGLAYVQVFKTAYTGSIDGPGYYSGSGEVLVSSILPNGTLEGYRSIGAVTNVAFRTTVQNKTHVDTELSDKPIDKIVPIRKEHFLDLDVSALTDFGEAFFRGDSTPVASVVGESLSFVTRLGYRYSLPQLNATDQVLKNLSAVTLIEGRNYRWTNKQAGTFEILADQSSASVPLVDGETVIMTYSAPQQSTTQGSAAPEETYSVRVEGLNNVSGGPVVLWAFRAARDYNATRALQSDRIEKNKRSLMLVADSTRGGKYYKELRI